MNTFVLVSRYNKLNQGFYWIRIDLLFHSLGWVYACQPLWNPIIDFWMFYFHIQSNMTYVGKDLRFTASEWDLIVGPLILSYVLLCICKLFFFSAMNEWIVVEQNLTFYVSFFVLNTYCPEPTAKCLDWNNVASLLSPLSWDHSCLLICNPIIWLWWFIFGITLLGLLLTWNYLFLMELRLAFNATFCICFPIMSTIWSLTL